MRIHSKTRGWRPVASFLLAFVFFFAVGIVRGSDEMDTDVCYVVNPPLEAQSVEDEQEFLECFQRSYNSEWKQDGFTISMPKMMSRNDDESEEEDDDKDERSKFQSCRCPGEIDKLWHSCLDCTHYFACSRSGEPVSDLIRCPEGTRFNERIGKCEWGDESICKESDSKALPDDPKGRPCPTGFTGMVPLDECKSYRHCIRGAAVGKEFPCPRDTLFDVSLKRCQWKDKVQCTVGKQPSLRPDGGPCPRNFTGWKAHNNCLQFLACRNGQEMSAAKNCPTGHLFDEERRGCHPAHKVKCSSRRRRRGLGHRLLGNKFASTVVTARGKCKKCVAEEAPPGATYSGDEGMVSFGRAFAECVRTKKERNGSFSGYSGILSVKACNENDIDW